MNRSSPCYMYLGENKQALMELLTHTRYTTHTCTYVCTHTHTHTNNVKHSCTEWEHRMTRVVWHWHGFSWPTMLMVCTCSNEVTVLCLHACPNQQWYVHTCSHSTWYARIHPPYLYTYIYILSMHSIYIKYAHCSTVKCSSKTVDSNCRLVIYVMAIWANEVQIGIYIHFFFEWRGTLVTCIATFLQVSK